jgi:hypothetical protein
MVVFFLMVDSESSVKINMLSGLALRLYWTLLILKKHFTLNIRINSLQLNRPELVLSIIVSGF